MSAVSMKMVLAQQKLIDDRGQAIRLKSSTLKWSQYDNGIKQEYALKTEKKARNTENIRTNHAKKVKDARKKALESGASHQSTGTGTGSSSESGSDFGYGSSESDDGSNNDSEQENGPERALSEVSSSSSSSSSSAPPPKKTKVYRVIHCGAQVP
ncbi:unnamed protein product [Rhizopus stolonifer]